MTLTEGSLKRARDRIRIAALQAARATIVELEKQITDPIPWPEGKCFVCGGIIPEDHTRLYIAAHMTCETKLAPMTDLLATLQRVQKALGKMREEAIKCQNSVVDFSQGGRAMARAALILEEALGDEPQTG
jgi:hypothetical protein